jgi:hypothetical protein
MTAIDATPDGAAAVRNVDCQGLRRDCHARKGLASSTLLS